MDPVAYIRHVVDVALWSEKYGCRGILVYSDNSLVDPWFVSQVIIQQTISLCPLVAVQPVYMHPYWVAKKIATLGYLYGRSIALNMVAGGFKNDLTALNDATPHDRRYDRMVEYTTIIQKLLSGASPVSYKGEFYTVDNLRLTPSLPEHLYPAILASGSSPAGMSASRLMGATAIEYPKPAKEYADQPVEDTIPHGIRVGIIARESEDKAWKVAHERFPEDRKGQLAHQLARKISDSFWYKQLSEMCKTPLQENSPYWLVPFNNYKTMCPYLVGSYQQVAEECARYMDAGFKTFILDVPQDEEELHHIQRVFTLALREVAK
jgi:alkanesulfonate monooxygenase